MRHLALLLFAFISLGAEIATATPDGACMKGRHDALAKLDACTQKAAGQFAAAQDMTKLRAGMAKCLSKYAAVWPRLQAKTAGTGALCDQDRFQDAGTIVVDNLTGLSWEKKTSDAT